MQQVAAQHSQSFEGMYINCPGLKVVMPSNAKDAKGLLKAAIRDPNPVVFIESEMLYNSKCDVPMGEYIIELGKADIKVTGDDVTIVAWSKSVPTALKAAELLAARGINAEVIDAMTLRPLDEETILRSVRRTNRAVVVQEAWPQASAGTWIGHLISEKAFDYLDAPVLVISGLDYPYAYAKNLEALMPPSPEKVVQEVLRLF